MSISLVCVFKNGERKGNDLTDYGSSQVHRRACQLWKELADSKIGEVKIFYTPINFVRQTAEIIANPKFFATEAIASEDLALRGISYDPERVANLLALNQGKLIILVVFDDLFTKSVWNETVAQLTLKLKRDICAISI